MLAIFQYATSGFWVFLGCLILVKAAFDGIASIIARLRKIPEYPHKCPRCGYDHDKEEDDQSRYDPHGLHLTFGSDLTHEQMKGALSAMADFYELTNPRRHH